MRKAKARNAMARLDTLRPTQITVGFHVVRHKMDKTRRYTPLAARRLLRRHRVRTVAGPGGALYIVDDHHWARAWLELGWRHVPVRVMADLRHHSPRAFWKRLRADGHMHPYDEHGRKRGVAAMPATLMGLRDDPYRSLAAFVRYAGAYRKPGNAHGDFTWAALMRRHIGEDLGSTGGFARAMALAIRLARSSKARRLPGWVGPCKGEED